MPPTDGQQKTQRLTQRPVPPPAALDLDLGPLQAPTPRSAESARPTGAARSAGPARPTWAAAAHRAAATDRGLGRPEAGGLGVPALLTGFLGTDGTGRRGGNRQGAGGRRARCRRAGGAGVAGAPVAAGGQRPFSGASFSSGGLVGADRGADATAPRRWPGRTHGCPGSPLPGGGNPAYPSPGRHNPGRSRHLRRCPESPRRPAGGRAPPGLRRETERQSHQLCCSRVLAAGGSEVAGYRSATSTRKAGSRSPVNPPNTNVTSWGPCSLAGQSY